MQWLYSRRIRYLSSGAALLFLVFACLRLLFLFTFSDIDPTQYEPSGDLWRTLSIGFRFDLRLAILMMLPLAVLCFLPRVNFSSTTFMRYLGRLYIGAGVLVVLLLYFLDFGHYDYLGVRLNATVFRFAGNAEISTSMLWQSYPVIWISLAWLLAGSLVIAAFLVLERHFFCRPPTPVSRWAATGGALVVMLLIFFGLLGRVSNINLENPVPLRWSDAFFSGDADLAATGLNPVIFLYDTAGMEYEPYDRELVREHYPLLADYLGVDGPDPSRLDFSRTVGIQPHRIRSEKPPNVVFVMLESLGASRVSAYGNPLETTPYLDEIARDGWFFERFFVPVTGTAKTIWASITGTPDVSQVETATRNPLITDQSTIINAFVDHEKFYMLGGSAGWANARALITQSIEGVTLYEEGDWQGPNVDVWGISDLQLFREANEILAQQPDDRPFFAYIQTAGNHRPFTIPEDRGDFVELFPSEEEVAQWGFRSIAQYNAVRFLDYSVGRFMEMARDSGYFDNTVFVFFGDHNNRITQLPHMPPVYDQLWLESNHVPHMIYAPKFLKPQVIGEAVSLVDMLPTVAGLMGVEYTTRTMGRDLQLSRGKERAVPLVLVEGSFPILGLVTSEFLVKMNADGSDATLHALNAPTADRAREDVSSSYPEEFSYLRRLTRGSYETARYMLFDNAER